MTALRRRHALGWQLTGLLVAPALVMAAIVLPVTLAAGHLPPQPARPFPPPDIQQTMHMWTLGWGAVWVLIVAAGLGTRTGRQHVSAAGIEVVWGGVVPIGYAIGGFLGATMLDLVRVNYDNAVLLAPDSPAAWPLATWICCAAMALLGAVIGDRVLTRCRPIARTSNIHTAWIADVSMDRFHVAMIIAPFAAVAVAATWWTGSQIVAAALVFPLLFELVNRTVHVVLSPQALVIRRGPFWLGQRRYPIEDITGIDVVPVPGLWARLTRSWVIRGGPALLLRRRNGAVTLVSLPQAEEAARVLRSWQAVALARADRP